MKCCVFSLDVLLGGSFWNMPFHRGCTHTAYIIMNRNINIDKFKENKLLSKTYFYLLCRRSWSLQFPKLENLFSQWVQAYGLSPEWILRWTLRLPFSANPLLQWGHLKLFLTSSSTSECLFIICFSSLFLLENPL